jgi:dTDP-4-amino-4,6-dideoxygalactose transaminase
MIGEEEKQAVMQVLESGQLVQGRRTAELEECFADLCSVRHAIATSSGTTALHTALLAHGIGPGDEVITSPFSFIASANSILFTGARPVFVDIEAESFHIDVSRIELAITERTRAIMPVHLYGQVCDMDPLRAIADKHGIQIIEDACQAVGAVYHGEPAGSFGTGTFSLYATKNVMSAEGGMITTDDDQVAERCRLIRNHGMARRYHYDLLGYNYRMSDVHAALGLVQMDRLSASTARRRENAAFLNAQINSVIKPMEIDGREHVWHQYTIRLNGGRDRDMGVRNLNEAGIGTGVFYPVPLHMHDYMRNIVGDARLPVAEQMSREVISLPVHPMLSQEDLATIVAEVNKL